MTAQAIIIFLVVGLVAGWLASFVLGSGGGLLVYLITGVLGAFVGPLVLDKLNLKIALGNPLVTQVLVSAVGAAVVVLIWQFLALFF